MSWLKRELLENGKFCSGVGMNRGSFLLSELLFYWLYDGSSLLRGRVTARTHFQDFPDIVRYA
jgi:hypothetical protein